MIIYCYCYPTLRGRGGFLEFAKGPLTKFCYWEVKFLGGGRNVEFQNVDRPKISERRNGLFS